MPKITAANFPDVDFILSIEVEHQLGKHTLESYVMSTESFITFLLKYTKIGIEGPKSSRRPSDLAI
jgi:hypothetical protein